MRDKHSHEGTHRRTASLHHEHPRLFVRSLAGAKQAGDVRARWAWAEPSVWTEANGLTLHPEKTCIVDEREPGGFDFLGYHFERGMKWPGKKSMGKLRDAVRAKTRRANGHSMAAAVPNEAVARAFSAGRGRPPFRRSRPLR